MSTTFIIADGTTVTTLPKQGLQKSTTTIAAATTTSTLAPAPDVTTLAPATTVAAPIVTTTSVPTAG
jgi:hypothetical protein